MQRKTTQSTAQSKRRSVAYLKRATQARDLRDAGLTWARVGAAMDPPVKARQAQNLAADAPAAVVPERKATQTGSQSPTQPVTPPPGQVMGILRAGADGMDGFWYTHAGRGERLQRSAIGTEERDEFDGTRMRAVAGAQRDEDRWNAMERALTDALDEGLPGVDVVNPRTGAVEVLTRDDLWRIRHRLRA